MKLVQIRTAMAAAVVLLASCSTRETDRELYVITDTNKDGLLSLEEVNRMALPRLFSRFDVNRDGSVTLEETREIEPGFEEKLFAERDLNKDGKVTYREFEKVALAKGGLKAAFRTVDTNHDGIINKAEADAHVTKLEKQATARN